MTQRALIPSILLALSVAAASISVAGHALATVSASEADGRSPAPTQGRPNVILIMTDDQGYGDMACHGNPVLKTPHMDRLHAESVRFTDFHVAPMCSPTRGQLLTGRDAMKTGCTAVCQGRSMVRAEIPTMADFFVASGYATGHFGKWHMGDSYPHRPQDRGFQETLHHRAWGITSLADYWENSYFDPVLEHNGVDRKFEGYCTDIFFDHAMRWIDRCVMKDESFFLYLPTNTPHVPNVVAKKYSEKYRGHHDGKPIPDTFYGMIANIDENLGKLEAFLREKKLRDNTILIYLTDNGTQSRQAQMLFNAGMRDRKTSVFEGGHRVPCFVRWPAGSLRHGQDLDELTQAQDLLPTLIELCGLEADRARFDGTSLAGLLKGTSTQLPDRKLVVQYRVSGARWNPAVVMWKKWRLVGPGRLYNIADDPHQDRNVAEKFPDIARAMAAHYDAWHDEARPLFDRPRWITVGSSAANPMMLYAQDWVGGYCDNRGGLWQARATGYWNVIVAEAGVYELELRRWPIEADLPLSSGTGENGLSGARPIAAASVQIGGASYTLDCGPKDTHVTFRVRLEAGKEQLATALLDSRGRTLSSAMYVKLSRLADDSGVSLTPRSSRTPIEPSGKKAAKPTPARVIQPNIVLCMTDDQGWGDVSYNGLKKIRTPNLDAMAATGMRFNRFYAQQSCSPARASVMTGRHPNRMGVFWPGMLFRTQEITLARAVKAAGYATGHFGKWHLNGVAGPGKVMANSNPFAPCNLGFDESFSVSNYFELDWTFGHNGVPEKVSGDGSEAIVARALEFIGDAAKKKKPFLAVVWFGSPHVPHRPLPADLETAGGSGYYGELVAVDRSMGTLRSGLRTLGIADNTIVWFSSDNGGWVDPARPGAHGTNAGLRGRKGDMWEGGIRVPCVIEWPAKIKRPVVTDVPAGVIDIYPTLVDVLRIEVPGQVRPIDGISLLPLLEGTMKTRPRAMGFWQYGQNQPRFNTNSGRSAWNDNRYKLVKPAPNTWELFDLTADPAETTDIAAEKPAVLERMKAELEAWQESVIRSFHGKDYPEGKVIQPEKPRAPKRK